MISNRQRILETLDEALEWCVENWRALAVLVPVGTFLFFALVIFLGLTVAGALATTKLLAAIELALAGGIFALNLTYRRQLRQWLNAADAIDAMIGKDDAFSDWDEFIAGPADDPEVERIRLDCLRLPRTFPPAARDEYCSQEGIELLQGYARRLRAGLATRAAEACAALCSAWRAARKPTDGDATYADDAGGAGYQPIRDMPDAGAHPTPTMLQAMSRPDEAASIKVEPPETDEPATTLPDSPEPGPARKPSAARKAGKTTTTKAAGKPTTTRKAPTSKKSPTSKKAATSKRSAAGKKAGTKKKAATRKKTPTKKKAA